MQTPTRNCSAMPTSCDEAQALFNHRQNVYGGAAYVGMG